jgi:hypothetical protein
MDPANAKALLILDSFREQAAPATPIDLPDRYLRAVERVEALPENREGADKSWVEASRREFREYIARARRARPRT